MSLRMALSASAYLDRVVMSGYDLNNPGNPGGTPYVTYFNSPLYSPAGYYEWSIDYSVKVAAACGIPASKVSISIPFYGDIYSINTAPYQTENGSEGVFYQYYNTLAADYNLSSATYDSATHDPWLAVSAVGGNPAGYLTFENAQSITDKINYVYANGLGGWMLWTMGMDYTSGSMPLLNAVGQAFGGQLQPPIGLHVISVN